MKPSCIKLGLVGAGVICLGVSFTMAGVIPEGYPVTRYQQLWEHSPFIIASVQPETAPMDGFGTKLALAGIAKIGTKDMAILVNKESQERITVGPEVNEQGIKLVSVESNADPLKASVTIQKGTETAKVTFDPALLAAGQPPPPNPGAQPPMPNPVQPNSNPAVPNAPVPRVRRTLPIPAPRAPNGVTTPPSGRPAGGAPNQPH